MLAAGKLGSMEEDMRVGVLEKELGLVALCMANVENMGELMAGERGEIGETVVLSLCRREGLAGECSVRGASCRLRPPACDVRAAGDPTTGNIEDTAATCLLLPLAGEVSFMSMACSKSSMLCC